MQHKATIFYEWEQGKSAYNFPFPYLSKQFVKVRVDHANTSTLLEYNRDYTIEGQTLTLTPVQPFVSGATLCIYRQTPTGSLVDFSDGSLLLASEMDRLSTQLLHVEEENSDLIASTGMFADDDNAWQGQGRRIKNLSDPQQPQDVVTLNYLDGVGVARQDELQRIEQAVRADKESTLSFKNEAASSAQDAAASVSASAQSAAASEASRQASAVSESNIKNMQVDVHATQSHVDEVKTAIDGVAAQAKADRLTASDAALQAQNSAETSVQSAVASEEAAKRAEAATKYEGVVKSENLAEKSVHKQHLSFEVYDKAEVDGRVNVKVNKSGDTMTGPLNFAENENMHNCIFPSHYFHNLYGNGDIVYIHAFPSHPAVARKTQFEFRTADGTQDKWTPHILNSDGFTTPTIWFNNDNNYIGDFKRDVGDAIADNGGANVNIASWYGVGFYSTCEKRYTGTMNLRNGDWRTVGKMKADGGFEGTLHGRADSAGNSDTLGGQSLQWIIDQINAAKTGIVAGNLAENGWVKFANGLIVQWGDVGQTVRTAKLPIAFPSACLQVLYTTSTHFNEEPDGTWFRLEKKSNTEITWVKSTNRFYLSIGI